MRPRHGENQVRIGRNLRRKLPSGEARCIAAEASKNRCRVRVNRFSNDGMGSGARCAEIMHARDGRIRRCESLSRGGATNISGTDKQQVQRTPRFQATQRENMECCASSLLDVATAEQDGPSPTAWRLYEGT